jgi:uncharacterized iron-regulated membrane protein
MTQKPSAGVKKGNPFVRAIGDLILLVLLLAGAGFGGYWYGLHQQIASTQFVPVQMPQATSVGDQPAKAATSKGESETPKQPSKEPSKEPEKTAEKAAEKEKPPAAKEEASEAGGKSAQTTTKTAAKKPGKLKYWITSTGAEYTGYSITVSINDKQIDNFFAPGKTVDITKYVKKGENKVEFNAQTLDAKYNQHKGDQKFNLTLNLVSGPFIQENYKPGDVILSYRRTAAEMQTFDDNMTFVGE